MWPDHTETKNLLREAENGTPEAIESLNDSDRELIIMRHFEQLTNQDVAKSLELSEAAVGIFEGPAQAPFFFGNRKSA